MKYKTIIILGLILITGTIFFISYSEFYYIEYLKMFKKDGIVSHKDKYGVLNGFAVVYVHGYVKYKVNLVNGKAQGWRFGYYQDGKIQSKIFFKNGVSNGDEYQYSENGKLKYHDNLMNGKRYGSMFWYLDNGKLDSYSTYNIEQKTFCVVQYDASGKVKYLIGLRVSPVLFSFNERGDSTITYRADTAYHDIKDLYFTVANPPEIQSNYAININGKDFDYVKVNDNTIKISGAIFSKGDYQIFVTSQISGPSGKKITVYFMHTKLKVE